MTKYVITSADRIAGVTEKCLRDMLWEAYYRGWESAARNRGCKPGELLNEPQKRAYREGYYARCSLEGKIAGFLEDLARVGKERK